MHPSLLYLALALCCALGEASSNKHVELPKQEAEDLLNNLLPSLDDTTHSTRRRQLAQQWTQFNNYFSGISGQPSPKNLPTYFGQNPGPCPLASAGHTSKCFVRACDMSPSIRSIIICPDPVPRWLLSCKRVDEWINCDDCGGNPGNVWIYDLDAGNLRMGGIYLDIAPQTVGTDNVAPTAAGFASPTSQYQSEISAYNQFRMTFTLSEVQVDADLKVDSEKLQLKSPLTFSLTKNQVGVILRKSDQSISGSAHAVSFRSLLTFRANKACAAVPLAERNPTVSPTVYDTTCIYRSDKVTPTTRSAYYRAVRTETFLEGVVYDINLPRTGNQDDPASPFAATACQWKFNNQYATTSPGAEHDVDLGLTLDIGPLCSFFGYDVCRILLNAILNLLIGAIITQILCQLFNQLFFLSSGSASNPVPTGNPGLLNVGIRTVYKFLKKYVEDPLSTKQDAEYLEDVFMPNKFNADGNVWPAVGCNTKGYCPYPDAIDFNQSSIFKSVSLGLNGILGNFSTTPGYTDKLVIVEVIDILTGNTNGDVPIGICPPDLTETCTLGYCAGTCDGDIKAELQLTSYPNFTWTGQPVFDGKIQLNGILIRGVNSITKLNLLDNGFSDALDTIPDYTHTLKNNFAMRKLGFELYLVIVLKDGTWVHRPRYTIVSEANKRTINMQTNIYVELKDIEAQIDLFMLLNPGRLADKYVGSIMGNFPSGSLTKRIHCAAFALDLVQLPRLQLKGSLQTLSFINFLGDLGSVVTQGTIVFNMGYRVATDLYLKFLADNFVRPKLNDYLMTNTYDGTCGTRSATGLQTGRNTNCTRPASKDACDVNYPYYFAPTDINRYLDFYNSRVWNVVKGVVNDVVGGVPVRTGAASINSLIDTYLEWYVPVLAKNNISVVKVPNNVLGKEVGNLDLLYNAIEIQSDEAPLDRYFRISDFKIRNLETIHELSLFPTAQANPRDFSIFFKLGGGKIWDRTNKKYIVNGNLFAKFHLATEVVVPVNTLPTTFAQDQADISVQFGNITFSADIFALINQNDMLDLRFGDMTKMACILSLVDDLEVKSLLIAFQVFALKIYREPAWRGRSEAECGIGKGWTVNETNPVFQSSTVQMLVTGCNAQRIVRFSDALDYLSWEANFWGSKVNSMLKYIFNGISNQAKKAANSFVLTNPPTKGCQNLAVGGGTNYLGKFLDITQNVSDGTEQSLSYWKQLTINKVNPRFPQYPWGTCSAASGFAGCAINYVPSGGNTQAVIDSRIGLPANYHPVNGQVGCVGLPNANLPGACWEERIEDDESAVDMRDNFVVKQVQSFIKKSGQKIVIDGLNALASVKGNALLSTIKSYKNGTLLPDGRGRCFNTIAGEESYCIDLDMNLTSLGVPMFNNSDFIPGLEVIFKRVRVLNIHTFDADPESFNLLYNYIPDQYRTVPLYTDSKYTLANRIKFGTLSSRNLEILVDVEFAVATEFLDATKFNTPAGRVQQRDLMSLKFEFANFDFQLMTTTAFNSTRMLEVPFYYFLDPLNPERCLYSVFYNNGLYLPQLQLQIEDLIGPVVEIKPLTPNVLAPGQANIFSKGVGYMITATIEILFQMIKSDIKDMTQGALRDYANRVLGDIVEASRGASGPGSCPQPESCGSPTSMCHYQKYNDASFAKILDIVNTAVGGDPVTTSMLDVNSLVELGLKYAILDTKGPLLLGSSSGVSHPSEGTWFASSVLNFESGSSFIEINNVGIKGLDSIYKLKMNTYSLAPYSFGLDVELGNGTMLNGSKITPTPFRSEPFTLQLELNMKVIANRPAPQLPEKLADNEFRVELQFAGINLTSIQEVLANRTDLFSLGITQVSKTQCALAFIDKVTLQTFALRISDFNVYIPTDFGRNPVTCGVGANRQCTIGKAIDVLRGEALITNAVLPPSQSKPLSMINLVMNNVGATVKSFVNSATFFNQTISKCEVPKVVFQIVTGVYTKNDSETLINHLLRNVTGILSKPRPTITADYSALTIQSNRAKNGEGKVQLINEVIASARIARGTGLKVIPMVLAVGGFCDTLQLPALVYPLCNAVLGTNLAGNLSQTLAGWTSGNVVNLIENHVPPSFIEREVRMAPGDQFYDVRTSSLVGGISSYFDKSVETLEDLLRAASNKTDFLRVEADQSISLVFNITDMMFLIDEKVFQGKTCEGKDKDVSFLLQDFLVASDAIIPGLRILPGMLVIRNFGSFSDMKLLKPYKTGETPELKAKFTTQHEFGWRRAGRPMNISIDVDMFYDIGFTNYPVIPLGTGVEEKETISIQVEIQDLFVQVLTLLAVDTKQLGEVRLGDFLNADANQKFLRNCKAVTCMMTGIFEGGLSLPQLSINVTDVVGPKFRTSNKLFSKGMELFIDSLLEIGVQLFRDDLLSLSQGPLRSFLNNKLVKALGDAKAPGACPERRNYTRDFPFGPNFCSHNDTTGVSPLLTQRPEDCARKPKSLNGPTCEWAPPDVAELDQFTVACFYSKGSKNLNFERAVALKDLAYFVNNSLLNEDSAFYMNNYLGVIANTLKTEMFLSPKIPLEYIGASYGSAILGLGEFTVSGLATVDRLQVFDQTPYGPNGDSRFFNGPEYELPTTRRRLAVDTNQEFGYQDNRFTTRSAIGFIGPVMLRFRLYLEFEDLFIPVTGANPDGLTINDVTIAITLRDLDLAIDLFMLVNVPRLMDLQIRSIGTIYELPCILEIFEDNGLIPVQFNVTYGTVGFEFCATQGNGAVGRTDSPMLQALQLTCFNDQTSNDFAASFTRQFQKLTNYLIEAAASSDLQDYLNNQISISNRECVAIKSDLIDVPDFDVEDVVHEDAAAKFGIAGLCIISISFVVFALLVPLHFRRRDELMKRALLDAHERGTAGKSKDEFELAERRLKSAFMHPLMPIWVKFGVPLVLIVNIIMFATANFASVGCTVELTLSIAGSETYPVTLLPFTLARSVNDMWAAGVYPLAFIIALASGGWPYAKIILLAFAWFVPSTVLHPSARGRMLEILDTLGKWSLIDIYVLIMLMVAFRFYISSSMLESFTLLPPNVLEVDVAVTPGWGIYGFCLGAMGNLVINHVMLWYHRKVIRADEDFQDAILGTLVKDLRTPRIPLSKHRFNILDAEGRPYRFSTPVQVLVVFTLVVLFLMLIVGSCVNVIQFNFRGIAGLAIAIVNSELSVNVQSVVSIGTSIIKGSRPDTASVLGIIFLQILYILFALVVPLGMMVTLLVIWLVPLTLREQLLLYFAAEVMSAWEACLILLVSLIAAVLQISQLAQFIVNAATYNLCSGIEDQLSKILPDPNDAKCFDVLASLLPEVGVFAFATVGLLIFGGIIFRLIDAAIVDRELAMRRKPPHSPGDMTGCQGFFVRRSLEAFGPSQVGQENVQTMYAMQAGAFNPNTNSMAMIQSNPIMNEEMNKASTSNPMYSANFGRPNPSHASIDV